VRQSRKLEHLDFSAALTDGPGENGFTDFQLVHNCLPGLALDDIDLTTSVAGISLNHPLIISAITGGATDVTAVNAQLAELARRTGAAMAVGSQYAAIEDQAVLESYKIVRSVYSSGTFFANIGAHATSDEARQAVEMIDASAIQIHLNVAQELVMAEGDRDFRGYIGNIAAIVAGSRVPVMVKEVGCGIAREQARALIACGVSALDVAGRGGTNFLAIEAARNNVGLPAETMQWGIPTAVSAVEVASVLTPGVDLIVSGGIRSSLEAVKSLAIGSRAVGIAGPLVKMLRQNGLPSAENWLRNFLAEMKRLMLLVGAKQVTDMPHVPLVISGYSRDWLTARGIDITKYANR